MSHSERLITRTRTRVIGDLSALLLLAAAAVVYYVQAAPPAYAATQQTGGLLASVNPGSINVDLAAFSATVTYTCTDTSAPGGQAQLRVDFDQHGNTASGETAVPCGPATSARPRPSPPSRSA